ncbi:MAG: PKD domain-containing protein [Actinomycetota bacterium]
MNRSIVLGIVSLLLAVSPLAWSKEQGKSRIISYGHTRRAGVEASAQAYVAPSRSDPLTQVSSFSRSAPGEQPPVPPPYIPNACGGIYGTVDPADLPATPQATAGGCSAFLVPPAAHDEPARKKPAPPRPQSLASRLADRVRELAPRPNLALAPARIGLTGLDSYFWLDDPPEPISATARAGPLTVTAEARPVRYIWDFGDGDDLVTGHAGLPWTRTRPGNVAHLYETRGGYELSVEVVWAARWRVNDGEWRPLGYFSNSDARPYRVRQIIAVLIRVE